MFSLRKFLVVLLSLGALALFAACSGSDGSDGKDGKDAVAANQEGVWTTQDFGAAKNNNCLGCHIDYTMALMDNEPIISRIIGDTDADDESREKAGYSGGVHFVSQYSSYDDSQLPATSGCGACHYRSGQDNRLVNNIFSKPATNNSVGVASCVECHGVENGHYARTTVKVAGNTVIGDTSDNMSHAFNACGNCHNADTDNYAGAANRHQPPHGNKYFKNNAGNMFKIGNHGRGINNTLDNTTNNILTDVSDHYTVCAACHTYNFSWKYNPMNGVLLDEQIEEIYHENAVEDANGTYRLLQGMANTGLGCASCHDAHTGALNSKTTAKVITLDNKTKDSYGNNILYATEGPRVSDIVDNPDNITNASWTIVNRTSTAIAGGLTVLSTEFQLCTSCHPVALKYEWIQNPDNASKPAYLVSPDGIGNGRLFPVNKFKYYLDDDVYGASVGDNVSTMDAGHHFFSPRPTAGATTIGMSYNGVFATNHFGVKSGVTVPATKNLDGTVATTITPAGMNIDAASPRPCTACHDPHNTSRFAATTADNKTALAGVISTFSASNHAAYDQLGWDRASYGGSKDCMPCHNGREAVKFMENGASSAWSSNAYTGMQSQTVNSVGGVVTGCGTCHDLDNTTTVSATATGGLANTVSIVGTLRMPANMLAAGGVSGRTDNMSAAVYTKQSGDGSMVCFTCHGGRTSLKWKAAEYGTGTNATQETYCDNGSGVNTEYSHYAPGAGVVAGLLLPKIKGATDTNGIEPRAPNGTTGISSHGGTDFFSCSTCHDLNKSSHTFAVFKDAAGEPLNHIVNKYDYSDTSVADNISGTMSCAPQCHGNGGVLKSAAKGFSGAMGFFEEVLQVKDTSNMAIQYLGSGGTIFNVWDNANSAFIADNTTNYAVLGGTKYWQGADGFKRYLVAMTFETLHYDYGAYAHAENGIARAAIGEALKVIFDATTDGSNATNFGKWLTDATYTVTAVVRQTADGHTIPAMSADGLTWLCGGTGTASDCATAYTSNW